MTTPNNRTSDATLTLGIQRVATSERRLLEAHYPTQAGLQRRNSGAQLVSMERKARLEPECVSRPEPCGLTPAATISSHRPPAASEGTEISTPSSPV